MWVVASTVIIMVAISMPPGTPPLSIAEPVEFPSLDALRHYARGRLFEERGDGPEALGEYYRALLLDPKAASLARRVSDLNAREGDHDRSLEFAERALTLDPSNPRGLWLKGSALFHLGRSAEALVTLKAAALADSNQVEFLQSLARVADQLDRLDLVVWAYERSIMIDENDGESWFQLAAARARGGDFETAGKALVRAVELNPMRTGMQFIQGWIQEGQGRFGEAIESYRRHLRVHSSDQVTRRRLVTLLARQERYGEAFSEAQQVSRARPEDVDAIEVEIELAFLAQRTSEALKLARRLVTIAAEDPEQITRVVALLARYERGREAISVADAWASRHPDDIRGVMLAARARALAGDEESAIEHARRAVDLSSDSITARVLLGQLYQMSGRYREAERVWAETVRRFPAHVGVALDLAYCREQLGDIAGAERAVRDILARQPNDATVLNFLGYLMADHARNLDEAHELIRRAVEQEPDNGAFIDSLGWVYYRLGRLADARRELERALAITGGDPVIHEHLGDVYKALQLMDLAREQYHKSLARDRSNHRVRTKLAELR